MAAMKLKQILQLEPANEILFQGPFEHVVTSYLELKNPSEKRVCFKVKTTAPKRYCVRPNSGILEPNGKIKIAIMLQPLDPDSEAEARTKHKFMVQSTIIQSDDENIPLDLIWHDAKPELIMDSKLRCVFQSPDQQDGDADPWRKAEPVDSNVLVAEKRTTAGSTSSSEQQQQAEASQNRPTAVTATAAKQSGASTTSSATASAAGGASFSANQKLKFGQGSGDKSMTSSHNLTSSFLQPMSDDYKIVLVSLIMLVLGVILGKYII